MIRSHGCLNWCSFEVDCNLCLMEGWLTAYGAYGLRRDPGVDYAVQHILIKPRIFRTWETYCSIQRMEELMQFFISIVLFVSIALHAFSFVLHSETVWLSPEYRKKNSSLRADYIKTLTTPWNAFSLTGLSDKSNKAFWWNTSKCNGESCVSKVNKVHVCTIPNDYQIKNDLKACSAVRLFFFFSHSESNVCF